MLLKNCLKKLLLTCSEWSDKMLPFFQSYKWKEFHIASNGSFENIFSLYMILRKRKKQNKQKTPNSYLQLVQALTLQTPDSRISL